MPRVLMIAYYFPPLGGAGTQRTLKFVRYLPELGWHPHVLTVRGAHYLVQDTALLQQVPAGLPLTATPAILPARFFRRALHHEMGPVVRRANWAGRTFLQAKKLFYTCVFVPDEYLGWLPFAVRAGIRLARKHDFALLYSSGPPNTTHVIAQRLARRTGLPWVADLRDLWDQYPGSYNPWQWRWRSRLDAWMEQRVLRCADHFVVVSETMRHDLLRKFPALSPARVTVITNGFDPEDFGAVVPVPGSRHFTIVHAGTLFPWRTLQPLLEALRLLAQAHPRLSQHWQLRLIGIVPAAERAAVAASGLAPQVEIVEYLPYPELLAQLRGADALVLLVGDLPHAGNMLTSKLFDYLGARRPILAIGPPGEVQRLVQHEKLGVALGAHELTAIIRTLANWMRQWQAGRPPDLAVDTSRFHRRELTKSLARVFAASTRNAPSD